MVEPQTGIKGIFRVLRIVASVERYGAAMQVVVP